MSNSNWWAKKLGTPGPTNLVPANSPPSRPVVQVTTSQSHRMQVDYDPNQDEMVTKATHVRKSSTCPECGSGNYMTMINTNYTRCYDCGYPVVQSGSGMTSSSGSGAAIRAAKQVSTSNNFNPQQIVGRID